MNTNPQAKGFMTSEFYITVVGVIASIFVAHGIITLNQVDPLVKDIADVYSGAVALITIWKIVETYIKGRNVIKQTLLNIPPQSQA